MPVVYTVISSAILGPKASSTQGFCSRPLFWLQSTRELSCSQSSGSELLLPVLAVVIVSLFGSTWTFLQHVVLLLYFLLSSFFPRYFWHNLSIHHLSYQVFNSDHMLTLPLPKHHQHVNSRIVGRVSLVAQWLRNHLLIQVTWIRALVWEDPTCHGATKPVHHKYWACALEPACHKTWSPRAYNLCSATREATTMRSPHAPQRRVAPAHRN